MFLGGMREQMDWMSKMNNEFALKNMKLFFEHVSSYQPDLIITCITFVFIYYTKTQKY